MRWFKRDLWKAGIAVASTLLLLLFMTWVPVSAAGAHEGASISAMPGTVTVQSTPTVDPSITAKTAQEQLTKLQRDNDRSFQAWFWSSGATLAVALAGVFGFLRYLRDQRTERKKQREDRRVEQEKRDQERFQAAVTGLGEEKTKLGAAITLRTFAQDDQFCSQAFDLAVAYLRLRVVESDPSKTPASPDSFSQAFIAVFKDAFPKTRDIVKKQKSEPRLYENKESKALREVNAREIHLDRAHLVEADLREAWMAEAHLRHANLMGVRLVNALLYKAKMDHANLKGAELEGTVLKLADLREANLSEADLRGADLSEADLSEADLSEANLEDSLSLKGTNLRGVKGLTKEQLATCKARDAIIEDSTTKTFQSTIAPSLPSQSNDEQASSAPPAQGNAPTPDASGRSDASSKPGPES